MMIKKIFLSILLLLSIGISPILSNPVTTTHTTASLISSYDTITPGQSFDVLVQFDLDPGWHSYWKDPGDSGLATSIIWTLPEGFTASSIAWQKPEIISFGDLTNFGFHKKAYHLVTITAPSQLYNMNTVTLIADVSWLVCEEVCIPASTPLSLTLSIGDTPISSNASTLISSLRETVVDDSYHPSSIPSFSIYLNALLFAFLGGLLLNLMPCVFPVLSLKAIGFLETPASQLRRQGLLYTSGVLTSFGILSGLLILLQQSGAFIGWGFQLQNTYFLGFLILLFTAMGLLLLDLIQLPSALLTLTSRISSSGPKQRESALSHFVTGCLACIVATPCTAPFMAPAIGVALILPPSLSFSIFMMLGFGLAFPFLLLSFVPKSLSFLPKPGPWLVTFKKSMAIPLFLTAIWLGWVFQQQLSFVKPSDSFKTHIQELRQSKTPVFVDVTAAWCITCKVNEKTVLNTQKMRTFFKDHGIEFLVIDWTHHDPAVTEYLRSFQRQGVPLYVFYPPNKEPVILPQLFTTQQLIDTLHDLLYN